MRWTNRIWRDLAPDTKLTVAVHEEDGLLWAEVKELPGCFASGDSMEELQEALAQTLPRYLSEPGQRARAQIRFWQKTGEIMGDPEPTETIDVLVS